MNLASSCDRRSPAWRRRLLPSRKEAVLVILAVLFGFLLWVLFSAGHVFNQNYREAARRISCQSQLLELSRVLRAEGIPIDTDHIEQINAAIRNHRFLCPSATTKNSHEENKTYFTAVTKDGRLVVTENEFNHDPARMFRTSLPRVRYALTADGDVVEHANGGL
jgi:hypothetical protein